MTAPAPGMRKSDADASLFLHPMYDRELYIAQIDFLESVI